MVAHFHYFVNGGLWLVDFDPHDNKMTDIQLQNMFEYGDVKPFKAFHYNGLGVREEDGTKKVRTSAYIIQNSNITVVM